MELWLVAIGGVAEVGATGVVWLRPRCRSPTPHPPISRNIGILEQGRHLQNCEAAIAKLRFCASLIVNDTMPIRLPRSSNNPPPDEPADTGALICMYCVLSSEVLRPDRRPDPSVL